MKFRYVIFSLSLFFLVTVLFFYLMIADRWETFNTQLKWTLRILTPLLIVYLFILAKKDKN